MGGFKVGKIEIKGNVVTLFRLGKDGKESAKTVDRRVALPDLIDKIVGQMRKGPVKTPILPRGARYYCKRGEEEIVVIEDPPVVRTVVWSEGSRSDFSLRGSKRPTLAFPFVIIICRLVGGIVSYRDLKCFYRRASLTSLDDELYHTNLQNVLFYNSWLCLGRPLYKGRDLAEKIDVLRNEFWSGPFTNDMGWGAGDDFHEMIRREVDPRVSSLEAWQKATRGNPLFVLEVPWIRTGLTARKAIRQMLGMLGEKGKSGLLPIRDVSHLADIMYRLREL